MSDLMKKIEEIFEEEVKKAKSLKEGLEKEIEQLRKTLKIDKDEHEKQIIQATTEIKTFTAQEKNKLNEIERDLNKRRKQIEIREQEQKDLEAKWEELKGEKDKIKEKEKELNKAIEDFKAKEQLAQLKVEQYEVLIKDLGEKPTVKITPEKRDKKKGRKK